MRTDIAMIFLIAFAILGFYFLYLLILEMLYAGRRMRCVTVVRQADPEKLARTVYRIRHQLPESEIFVLCEKKTDEALLPWPVGGVTDVSCEELTEALRTHLAGPEKGTAESPLQEPEK